MSDTSSHDAAPDLSLERVAFARIFEGRVVARGTADRLAYRRAGGGVTAADGSAFMEPTKGYTSYGTLHFTAPAADGEISGRSGVATGGVHLDTAHGDAAATERVEYEGAAGFVRSATPVDARGPGYRVHGNGLLDRDVHLSRSDLTVTGQHALVEYEETTPPPRRKRSKQPAAAMLGGQSVRRFEVDGNVHVERGARTADGEHGVVDIQTQTIVLTGTPEAPPVLRDK